MALSDGIVPFNPPEIRQGSGVFDLRERLIFLLAIFEGLRPGEILALRLGNVFDDHVAVEQRVYKGTLDTPKGRNGRRTARKVALSPGTANGNSGLEDYVVEL